MRGLKELKGGWGMKGREEAETGVVEILERERVLAGAACDHMERERALSTAHQSV